MRFGREIKDNPRTFQEKLIWLQFYDKMNWLKPICSDKIKVREYVKEKIGSDICVPLLKVYDSPDDINLNELPDKFILKTNHASGQFIRCRDKSKFNLQEAKSKLKTWLSRPYGVSTCEPHYLYIDRKCYAETLLENTNGNNVDDYKLYCFNGKPRMVQMECDKGTPNARFQYYDMNLKFMNICRTDHKSRKDLVKKDILPKNLNIMKEYAEKLAAPFKFVRVDFYEVNGTVYFGEMTFVPGAANFSFTNPNISLELGKWLNL